MAQPPSRLSPAFAPTSPKSPAQVVEDPAQVKRERDMLAQLLQQVARATNGSIEPVWQKLKECHPNRKTEVITWLFLQTLKINNVERHDEPRMELWREAQKFGVIFDLPKVDMLIAALNEKEEHLDVEAIAAAFLHTAKLKGLSNQHYNFIFKVLWERNGFHPAAKQLIDILIENYATMPNPALSQHLFSAIREGKFVPPLRGNAGLCTWFKMRWHAKGTAELKKFLWSMHPPQEITEMLLAELPENYSEEEAWVYLSLLGKIYTHQNPRHIEMRDQILAHLPSKPGEVIGWLAHRVPQDDPLFAKLLQNCTAQDVLEILGSSYESEALVQKVFECGPSLQGHPNWLNLLTLTIPLLLMHVRHGFLHPHERQIFIEWIKGIGDHEKQRERLIQSLIDFIDFPHFWPHCRIRTDLGPKHYTELLFYVAHRWPELRLAQAQQPAFPHTCFDLRRLTGHALYHHHFPELMSGLRIPLQVSSFSLKRLLIIYVSLSSAAYRKRFAQELPALMTSTLALMTPQLEENDSDDEDNEVWRNHQVDIALLFLKILGKLASDGEHVSLTLAPQFSNFIKLLSERLNQNDLRGQIRFIEDVDKLKGCIPDFFEGSLIDLAPVETIRTRIKPYYLPKSRID